MPYREPPAVGQEGGTENASLQGAWEKMACEEASHGRQAQSKPQAGLSLCMDSDFGTLRCLEAESGGSQHQVGSLVVGS